MEYDKLVFHPFPQLPEENKDHSFNQLPIDQALMLP